ncbi:MAG: transposase [Actinomycetota bacterium]|nr:transposase [Actinomycetota bacterium]
MRRMSASAASFPATTEAVNRSTPSLSASSASFSSSRPPTPLPPLRQTPFVKRGDHLAPTCEHGTWTFAGSDAKRGASKWRCPTGECAPKSRWVKADRLHPLIPRETKRWRDLYRGRAAVEREFGRLKHEYGLAPLRVRGLARVQLHADLTMLARLAQALSRARAQVVPTL